MGRPWMSSVTSRRRWPRRMGRSRRPANSPTAWRKTARLAGWLNVSSRRDSVGCGRRVVVITQRRRAACLRNRHSHRGIKAQRVGVILIAAAPGRTAPARCAAVPRGRRRVTWSCARGSVRRATIHGMMLLRSSNSRSNTAGACELSRSGRASMTRLRLKVGINIGNFQPKDIVLFP